jgi:hypothetical protein
MKSVRTETCRVAGLIAALCVLLLCLPAAPSAAATTTLPGGARRCAVAETGTCAIPAGTTASVYYGAGTSFLEKTGVTGSIGCNQTAFGGDPDYGVVKACYVIANVLPAAAVLCAAAESGTCTLPSGATATVYYGAGSSFIYVTGVTGSMACNQTAFGGDPEYGVVKACYAFVSALPAATVQCSGELGTCTLPANVSATVYYGAGSRYSYQQGITGSVGCNPTSFGGDPDQGIVKACYAVVNTLPPGALQCAAAEAGTCTPPSGASVTVFYGANGSYLYRQGVTSSIGCNQTAFGGDPDYGVVKACYDLAWVPVNLAPYFNVPAISSDTAQIAVAIYNQGGPTYTYSAAALGATATWNGSTFTFGAPDVNDAVSNATITLPTGSFGRLDVLASRTYGSSAAETFIVTYSDGTQSTFTQGMSDWWHNPSGTANYTGESTVAYPSYIHAGAQGNYQEPASVYGYTFALNPAKVVKSVKLPSDPFVGVLAMNLGPANVAPIIPAAGPAQSVVTQHNDGSRTGMNAAEYQLTPATVGNVTGSRVFGRLGSIALDESADAQPLVVPNVSVAGDPNAGTHDVVYAATEANTVYAIDPVHLTILTKRNLGAAVPNPVGSGITYVGITSTPVIDTGTGVMYVVAYVQAAAGPAYQLHMLSLSTLADVVPPVTIAATATLNNGTSYPFNAMYQRQRPSLLETGGLIVVAFGSFGDLYANLSRGWIVTYDAATLALNTSGVNVLDKLSSSVDGVFLSSVWMSGAGPAVDENGDIYFSTGNSDPGSYDGVDDIQESVVKLNPATAQLLSLYTPEAVETYDINDTDVGSGGVLLLPNPNKRVGAILSKDGLLRVFDRDNLGGNNDSALVTSFGADPCWCQLSYFNNGQDRLVSSGNETLRVLTWQTGTYPALIQQGTAQMPGGPSPGAVTSISSGGPNNGIIWVVPRPLAWTTPGVNLNLMAFQATPVNGILPLLYLAPAGGWAYGAQGGGESNNAPPTVANGRVYVASYQQLTIFGFGGQR